MVKKFVMFLLVGGCLAVLVMFVARSIEASAPHLWSESTTWNGRQPVAGADVTIPAGRLVVLDTDPPPLHSLTINGTLRIADRDVKIVVDQVTVHGRLEIGQKGMPFRHHCDIALGGPVGDTNTQKVIYVIGGDIELHGAVSGADWTSLAAIAGAGDSTISLNGAVHWGCGDRLVIASTDFAASHAEEVKVSSCDGLLVTLARPLKYLHWGGMASGVNESAEVGLLSRNIAIHGDESSLTSRDGGQLMVMKGSTAHIEGVSFESMGRIGELGKYPLHFHLAGDMSGSFVRSCSFAHCFNRCLTIHGTQNLEASSNVAYDTIGHCYFLEDGVETGNRIVHNLGVLTRSASKETAILPSDTTPATFWISNPSNVVEGNAAGGSDGYGFWYNLPEHPSGPSRTEATDKKVWPRRTPLGRFENNVAHSNAFDGLIVDNGPNPPGVTSTPNYDPRRNPIPRLVNSTDPAPAVFDRLTAYKNRKRGAWLRGSWLRVENSSFADNATGLTFAASDSQVNDSLVVGETENAGTADAGEPVADSGRCLPKPEDPNYPISGFELYDGLVGASNVTFVNFVPNKQRRAGAIGFLQFSPWFVNPRNWVSSAKFVNANRVSFEVVDNRPREQAIGDGYRSAGFVDANGSVTGEAGAEVSVAGSILEAAGGGRVPAWNAIVSTHPFARLFVDNQDIAPKTIAPVVIDRTDKPLSIITLYGSPAGNARTSFQANLPVNESYGVQFAGASPGKLRVTLRCAVPGQWMIVNLPTGSTILSNTRASLTGDDPVRCTSSAELASANRTAYWVGSHGIVIKLVSSTRNASPAVIVVDPDRPTSYSPGTGFRPV